MVGWTHFFQAAGAIFFRCDSKIVLPPCEVNAYCIEQDCKFKYNSHCVLTMDATGGIYEATSAGFLNSDDFSETSEAGLSTDAEIAFYYKLFMFLLGCLGNITNVVVIQYTKTPKTTRIIITILAVSDLLYLLFDFPALIFPKLKQTSYYLYSATTCKLSIFCSILLSFVSYYMVALLTIDRCLAVVLPLHSKVIFSPNRLIILIVFLVGAELIWVSFLTADYDLYSFSDENGFVYFVQCDSKKYFEALQYASLVVDCIPLFCVVVGNIIISVSVCRHFKKRSEITGENRSQNTESKLIVTILSISVCFVVLATPMTLYWTVGDLLLPDEVFYDPGNLYFVILDCMHYTNFTVNFLLYVAFTKSFREQLNILVLNKLGVKCGFKKGSMDRSSVDTVTQNVSATSM